MVQQVRVVQKGLAGRDTTEGKLYDVIHFAAKGEPDVDGVPAASDSYSFVDDVGDTVTAWLMDAVVNRQIYCGVELVH